MNRRGVVGAALVTMSLTLAGCAGSESGSASVLTWWVVPDRVDAQTIAETCADEGGYTVEIEVLPTDIDQRRSEIVRQLAAGSDAIDILSLDTSLTAEMAAAGFLATIPPETEPTLTEGVLPKAVEAATHDERLVAVPWWLDPQVLWYRGTSAERAGLDTTKPINWDDLLGGAERLGSTLQIDDPDGTGLGEWVRVLVAAAGGTILDGDGRDPEVGLATDAGRTAAGIVQFYASADIGPGPSPDARAEFAGVRGGFLLASSAIITDPVLSAVGADMQAVPYPVLEGESIAPLSGVSLAVPKDARDTDLAFEAVTCLTSEESQQTMMTASGHGATRSAVYEDDEVKSAIAATGVMLEAIETGVNVPATPYWQRVRVALRDTWLPITGVSPSTTPADSQRAVTDLVAGGLR